MVSSIPSVLKQNCCFRVFIVNWTLLCGKGQETSVFHDFWKISIITLEISACSWHLEKKAWVICHILALTSSEMLICQSRGAVCLSLQGKQELRSGARKPASADLFVCHCCMSEGYARVLQNRKLRRCRLPWRRLC